MVFIATFENLRDSKSQLRQQFLRRREELPSELAFQLSETICKNLLFTLAEKGLRQSSSPPVVWGAYQNYRGEVNLKSLFVATQSLVRWAFPVVLPNQTMEFRLPAEKDANWIKNKWDIWEPDPRTSVPVELNQLQGLIIPGVAFDRTGQRLGYGKGFYDQTLHQYEGFKVGVAFDIQVTPTPLPINQSDVAMNIIVTESEMIHVGPTKKLEELKQ